MTTVLRGARCALGPWESSLVQIHVSNSRVTRIEPDVSDSYDSACTVIDLSGFLLMPGLVNAHDHLQYALHPRIGNPPYRSYIDWGEDIHATFPDTIAQYKLVSRDVRLWWGGIRNLLCGVTTVCHHNTMWSDLLREDFPVKVVQRFGWGHSLALGGDLHLAHSLTPQGSPFIVHVGEGVDDWARNEVFELDGRGLLDANTVLVHSLAVDADGVALLKKRQASIIVCPSSNSFLFGELPNVELLGRTENIALGSDSPLTSEGDLLDEIRFAIGTCGVSPDAVYRMVTESPATLLRLKDGEGRIKKDGSADFIAVRDDSRHIGDRLPTLSMTDIEYVMVRGVVHLASEAIIERIPLEARLGLESLIVDGVVRWIRAPVEELLHRAEQVLGANEVRLGGRRISLGPRQSDVVFNAWEK